MKLRKKAVVNVACALALASNSLGAMAQDKQKTQIQQQNKVIVKTVDGQSKEFTVEGDGGVFVDQNGQKIRFSRTVQGDSQQIKVIAGPEAGAGGVVSFTTQGGVTTASQGQDMIFVRGQAEPGQAGTFSFVSSEMSFENKLVKGAPFSAEIENESIQTLGDGNRIVHKSDGSIHRDGEGRMRREQSIGAVGAFANGDNMRTITITDPVAGSIYTLEPNSHTAHKMSNVRTPMPMLSITRDEATMPTLSVAGRAMAGTGNAALPRKISVSGGILQGSAIKKPQPAYPPVAKAAKASGAVQVQITVSEEGKVIDATVISGHPLLRDPALEAARQWEFKPVELSGAAVKVQGVLTFNFTLAGDKTAEPVNAISSTTLMKTSSGLMIPSGMKINSNTESLGKQTIEGVEAEGKRTTTTIPAGAIGNERPIEMVNETWYSPELQTTVMSKRSDPRMGETIFRLTNIRRGEPDASLFQVPSDYTVKEGEFKTSSDSTFNYRVAKPDNQ